MFFNIRRKIRRFINQYKKLLILGLIIWLVILGINYLIGRYKINKPETSYQPHTPIISGDNTPKSTRDEIEELIANYIKYANNKEYEKAYDMLSEEFKQDMYPKIIDFKQYINSIFTNYKLYSVQSYANLDNIYIYQVKIFDDILATGLTGVENYSYYDEKVVVKKEDGKLKFALREYMGSKDIDFVAENDKAKIWIEKVQNNYSTVTYTLKIRNKTDYIAIFANGKEDLEVIAQIGQEKRGRLSEIWENKDIIVEPGKTSTFKLEFEKFYNETSTINSIIFNNIRLVESYGEEEEEMSIEEELTRAVDLYSLKIPVSN